MRTGRGAGAEARVGEEPAGRGRAAPGGFPGDGDEER